MKNILIITAILFFSLDFYGQDMDSAETIDSKEIVGFNLEVDKKNYTLYLSGTTNETGYFIKFKDKKELEKFLRTAIKLTNNSSKKYPKKIECTGKDLKFCKIKGTKQQIVVMEIIDGSTDSVLISSTQTDTENDELKWLSGSHKFSKSELNELYKTVFSKDFEENVDTIQVFDDDTEYFNLSGSGSNGLVGGGAGSNNGVIWLEGRRSTIKPKASGCQNVSGSIVVSITVNQSGKVISAQVGEKGTTSFDQCLLLQAMESSLRTKFNVDHNAPNLQVGMITFNFVPMNKQNQKKTSFGY